MRPVERAISASAMQGTMGTLTLRMDVQVNFSSPTIEISHFFFAKNRDIYS
jgi:hypothetical protein